MLEYGRSYLEENKRSYDALARTLDPEAVQVALTIFPMQSDEDERQAEPNLVAA
ncbi:hypothetical protein M9M90_07010 [Phenylobacterium sp. LH3H17]|uniref:hypothetical protein n=1 Tax=Phenylobacterium sp. LH3H17 TaxID=2903901 RepID=UPI0020C95C8B|nr:hypothetical protein [Phenylobacterium sp. LH3H17]UTP40925.1 hypothetical protein M9M90_07010 [Phenylobacterium sp. LH3H17]